MSKSKLNGAVVELPNGVKVHCPEDGGPIQGPVTVDFNGGQITCPDARSLVTAISMTLAQFVTTITNRKQGDGKQGTGPKRAWKESREFREKFNKGKPESEQITDDQARKMLAQQKRQQKLEFLLKKNPDKAKKHK